MPKQANIWFHVESNLNGHAERNRPCALDLVHRMSLQKWGLLLTSKKKQILDIFASAKEEEADARSSTTFEEEKADARSMARVEEEKEASPFDIDDEIAAEAKNEQVVVSA